MSKKSKHEQLRDILKSELRSGRFKAGDRFYTDKELMAKHQLSYATVSRTLSDMVKAGYFERHRGLGTFVKESPETPGMVGDIMTKPVYVDGPPSPLLRQEQSLAWFIREGIRRGIINNYPGPVKIEPFETIRDLLESGEDILAIIQSPPKEFVEKHGNGPSGCVIINYARDFRMEYNSVTRDIISGVYELMRYLIVELGHRQIGYIGGGRPEYHAERFAGYRIGLEAHGISYREEFCVRDLFGEIEDGRQAMESLLELPAPPSAVFVDTDMKAVGAIKAVNAAGLNVPRDISIAGYDDIPGADAIAPPLTTVRMPYYEIGAKAVEMLMKRLRGSRDIPSEMVMTSLVVRESCAPPRDG